MHRNDHPGGMFPPQIPPGWSPQVQATEPGEINFQLTLPVTRFGFGPFSVDPVEQLLGCSIAHLLEPAMTAPMFQRPSAAGPTVNVYPLNLPVGEGLSIRLGQFGELGLFNDRNLLRLSVPWSASSWIQQRLAPHIVHGPEEGLSADGAARVAHVWIVLRQGMRAVLPIKGLGELGVEVGQ